MSDRYSAETRCAAAGEWFEMFDDLAVVREEVIDAGDGLVVTVDLSCLWLGLLGGRRLLLGLILSHNKRG